MGFRRAGWWAGSWVGVVAVLLAQALPAAAQRPQPAPSGFGKRLPAINGITTASTGRDVSLQLGTHGDRWGAKARNFREDTAPGPNGHIQRISLQLSPQSNEERTRFGGNDTFRVEFSGPASGNTAVWVLREQNFTGLTTPLLMPKFIETLFADYGKPTLVADGRILWQFRNGGQLASVGRSYTPQSAIEALRSPKPPPDPPLVDTALGVDVMKCQRATEVAQAARDVARFWQEATCDAAIIVNLSSSEDRVRTVSYLMVDFERRAGNAAIDAKAREAADKR